MRATVEILAQNAVPSLGKTVESLASLGMPVLVGVLAGGDWETPEGWSEVRFRGDADLSWARNELQKRADTEFHLRVEPGEFFVGGEESLADIGGDGGSLCVLRGDLMVKEARVWRGFRPFKNPVYETQSLSLPPAPAYLYSPGHPSVDAAGRLARWEQSHPSDPDPLYYKAFHALANREYESFRRLAQEYLFLEKRSDEPAVMTRYYLASVQAAVFGDHAGAVKNVCWCILHRPFMSEFWCLLGDIYTTLGRYREAAHFFKDALQAAEARPKDDLWPMIISRNSSYPRDMIAKCERALACAVPVGSGWMPNGSQGSSVGK